MTSTNGNHAVNCRDRSPSHSGWLRHIWGCTNIKCNSARKPTWSTMHERHACMPTLHVCRRSLYFQMTVNANLKCNMICHFVGHTWKWWSKEPQWEIKCGFFLPCFLLVVEGEKYSTPRRPRKQFNRTTKSCGLEPGANIMQMWYPKRKGLLNTLPYDIPDTLFIPSYYRHQLGISLIEAFIIGYFWNKLRLS